MSLERMHKYIGVRVYMRINQYEDVSIEISWYFTNFFLLVYGRLLDYYFWPISRDCLHRSTIYIDITKAWIKKDFRKQE